MIQQNYFQICIQQNFRSLKIVLSVYEAAIRLASPSNPPLIAIFLLDASYFPSCFCPLCRHSQNSRAYRAPRKDVIDYTRRSRAEILRVVWIYRAIKMPPDVRARANAPQCNCATWWKSWREKRITTRCATNCASAWLKKKTVMMRTLLSMSLKRQDKFNDVASMRVLCIRIVSLHVFIGIPSYNDFLQKISTIFLLQIDWNTIMYEFHEFIDKKDIINFIDRRAVYTPIK